MTQLDLPQVSFARYLDLLKRHRWRVAPVSLLGMLVGGIVAFMIPRYYVASTVVEFEGSVLGLEVGVEDPMAGLIDTAEVTIPFATEAVLDELQWPEYMAANDSGKQALIGRVRGEIKIVDLNPSRRRKTAQLRITYRDTDGHRAERFTNELVRIWKQERLRDLTGKADKELSGLNRDVQIATKALDSAEREIVQFERQWRLNPQDFMGDDRAFLSAESEKQRELERSVALMEQALAGTQVELDAARQELDTLLPTVPVPLDELSLDPVQKALVAGAMQKLQVLDLMLTGLNPSNRDYELRKRLRDRAQADLELVQSQLVGGGAAERPNQDYTDATARVRALETQESVQQAALDSERARFEEQNERIDLLSRVMEEYRSLTSRRDTAQADIARLGQEQADASKARDLLRRDEPHRVLQPARLPERPTEPNITLVALAGSAVGLAFAIGLILLIDVLQSTFKTVDDVERLLALPVLGGLSYMTTEEDVQAQAHKRNRVGLAVGAVLLLLITLITLYYVDPTRLPEFLRDAFDLILLEPTPPEAGG